MANAHQLIATFGLEQGLFQARAEGLDPKLAAILHGFYGESGDDNGFQYAGLCLLGLPHRRLEREDMIWERELNRPDLACSLIVEPGLLKIRGKNERLGVPFGPAARMILIYLQTQAVRSRSREVRLGSSMRDWLNRMGMSIGGRQYDAVRDQAKRISACTLRFIWGDERSSGFDKDSIIKRGLLLLEHSDQMRLWDEHVVLGETFYHALCERPVPINLNAIRQIANSSQAIDVYIWLAYRLHALKRRTELSWSTVRDQFGPETSRLDRFRDRFSKALEAALCVYPDARVTWDSRALVLYPSPPPVRERSFVALPPLSTQKTNPVTALTLPGMG